MEVKKNTAKEKNIELENDNSAKETPKKLSYEELARMASELQFNAQKIYQENQQLKMQLQNQGASIRISYLFEILKNDKYFSSDDCYKCAEEIRDALLYSEEDEEETEKEDTNK